MMYVYIKEDLVDLFFRCLFFIDCKLLKYLWFIVECDFGGVDGYMWFDGVWFECYFIL